MKRVSLKFKKSGSIYNPGIKTQGISLNNFSVEFDVYNNGSVYGLCSGMGIYDFAVDTQGQSIAYTMRDEVNLTRDIYILDLDSGDERRLTFCGDASAECFSPVFHPNDPVIAYTRLEIASSDDEYSEEEEGEHAGHDHSGAANLWRPRLYRRIRHVAVCP